MDDIFKLFLIVLATTSKMIDLVLEAESYMQKRIPHLLD